jgi:hypothetical protein
LHAPSHLKIHSIKRADGKVFSVGDKFTTPTGRFARSIVLGKLSRRKNKICGFEVDKEDSSKIYVLYMPQYSNGVIEKKNPWRACVLDEAIHLK